MGAEETSPPNHNWLDINLPDVGFHDGIPSPSEITLLDRAERKEVLCLSCEVPLTATLVVAPDFYIGVVLACGSCSFEEH